MNKIMRMLMGHSCAMHELGHMVIRIGIGLIFVIIGFMKLFSGVENLTKVGSAIAAFGILRGYLIWGYLAALTEFCGGLAYMVGFCTRLACVPLLWLLVVALRFHIDKGDPITAWGFPLTLLIVIIGFILAGSGRYSVDSFLTQEQSHDRYEL